MKQKYALAFITFFYVLFTATSVNAEEIQSDKLVVSDAWARKPLIGAMAHAVYLTITNENAKADTLIKVETPVAGIAEVHSMNMEGDVMRMRQLKEMTIPSGENVTFEPGGMHIMLMELKEFPEVGDSFPLTLIFTHAGQKQVNVVVKK